MRVDKDWEEGIGKKLFEFEGELSPQAWNNINQRIKPNQYKKYRWLAALLFFLMVPAGLYLAGTGSWLQPGTQNLSRNSTESDNPGVEESGRKTVRLSKQVPGDQPQNAKPEIPENARIAETQTGEINPPDYGKRIPNTSEMPELSPGKKPLKNLALPGLIASTRPAKPKPLPENQEQKASENQEVTRQLSPSLSTGSRRPHAGLLALQETPETGTMKLETRAASNKQESAQTVAFSKQKAGASENSAAKEEATTRGGTPAAEASAPQPIALLPVREPAFGKGVLAVDRKEMLPDSMKKHLATTLPMPEASETNPKKTRDNQTASAWEIAVYGMPQYSFQRVLPNRNDDISITSLENKNSLETERIGYEFGLRACYPLRKNLRITFGIQVANINQHLRMNTVSAQPDSVNVVKQNDQVSMQIYHTTHQEDVLFRYFSGGIFSGLNMHLSEKLELAGGFGLNWLLQSKATTEKAVVKATTVNPYLHMGLQYTQPLSQKITLNAGPVMQYYLNPLQKKQAFVGIKPTILGFSAGIKYKL